MLGKRSTGSFWTSLLSIACFLTTAAGLEAQTEIKGHELTEVDEAYLHPSGAVTRCGTYFVLETKTYGELEVRQVHLAYTFAEGSVALSAKTYRDLDVVVDDGGAVPKLFLKRENPDLEKDRLELSDAIYQEAKACVPPPKGDQGT